MHGNETEACKQYGCQYSKDIGMSIKLPHGYVLERCKWCGDERTVLEY